MSAIYWSSMDRLARGDTYNISPGGEHNRESPKKNASTFFKPRNKGYLGSIPGKSKNRKPHQYAIHLQRVKTYSAYSHVRANTTITQR